MGYRRTLDTDDTHVHVYTYIGGWQRSWIMDNLASLTLGEKVEAIDQNCHADVYADCEDSNFNYFNDEVFDKYGDPCLVYTLHTDYCGQYDTDEFVSEDMCCACGGG